MYGGQGEEEPAMSEQPKRGGTTRSDARTDLSRETAVKPRPVSEEFIAALRDAGARPSLVVKLEKERAARK